MSPKRIFTPKRIVVFFILVIMTIFITQSDIYMESVRQGLSLYLINILPAMLPFFFFSKLLTELNFARDLSPIAAKPLSFLYRAKPIAGYILIMSMFCGYPVGAKLLSEFYLAGYLTQEEAKRISSFTSAGGPIFIVGTVGVAMLHNKTYGFLLLVSHYASTLLNGLIYRKKTSNVSGELPPLSPGGDVLNKSMTETFLSLGNVGGYIVLFNMLIDMVTQTGLIGILVNVLSFLRIPSRLSCAFLYGLIEMTRGCKSLSSLSPLRLTLPCCSFLLTFGGLSVTFQSLSYLAKIKISPAYYLLTKTTQGLISAILTFLMCLLFRL